MKTSLLLFALTLTSSLFVSCSDSGDGNDTSSPMGEVTLTIDKKVLKMDGDDIVAMSFVNGDHLVFSAMSESKDLQFSFSAYATTLSKTTLTVYECNGPSVCEMAESDLNQFALLAPYIKDPLPPVSDSRSAYKAVDLGLAPLTVTITDVFDEQQEGAGLPTKRIKGTLTGTLTYVEQQPDGKYLVKSSTNVEGSFNMFCTIR